MCLSVTSLRGTVCWSGSVFYANYIGEWIKSADEEFFIFLHVFHKDGKHALCLIKRVWFTWPQEMENCHTRSFRTTHRNISDILLHQFGGRRVHAQQHFQSLTIPSTSTSTVPQLGRTVKKGQIISDASHLKLAIGERTSPTCSSGLFFFQKPWSSKSSALGRAVKLIGFDCCMWCERPAFNSSRRQLKVTQHCSAIYVCLRWDWFIWDL